MTSLVEPGATRIYGQGRDGNPAVCGTTRKGGFSRYPGPDEDLNYLDAPTGLLLDSADNLFVSDGNGDRVVCYPPGGVQAVRAYGLGDSGLEVGSQGWRNPYCSATSMCRPGALALDSRGNLHVADTNHSRVLRFPAAASTVPFDVVQAFCPEFRFHPREQHFPCPVEHVLAHATLRDRTDPAFAIVNPSQADLYDHWEGFERYCVDIAPSQFSGGPRRQIYYCVQPVDDPAANGGDTVDITYLLLYAWQHGQVTDVDNTRANAAIGGEVGTPAVLGGLAMAGPLGALAGAVVAGVTAAVGAAVGSAAGDFEAILSNYGEHQGDLERVTVRLRAAGPGSSVFTCVRVSYEQHGNPVSYEPGHWDNVEATHPIAAIGLGQHPTYNPHAVGYGEQRVTVQDVGVFKVVDAISDTGDHWRPWTERGAMVEVGLRDGQPINDEIWARFQGRFGLPVTPHLNSATYLDGRGLDTVDWNSLVIIGRQVEGIDSLGWRKALIPAEDGPNGLNGRSWMVLPPLRS